jgi:hypothetical protein
VVVGDTSFPSVRFATTVRFIPKKRAAFQKRAAQRRSQHQDDIVRLEGGSAGIQTRCCAAVLGQTPLSHQKTFPSDTLIGGQKPPRFTSNRSSTKGACSSKKLDLD